MTTNKYTRSESERRIARIRAHACRARLDRLVTIYGGKATVSEVIRKERENV